MEQNITVAIGEYLKAINPEDKLLFKQLDGYLKARMTLYMQRAANMKPHVTHIENSTATMTTTEWWFLFDTINRS